VRSYRLERHYTNHNLGHKETHVSNLTKYLAHYAEPEVKLLSNFTKQIIYSHVVIIPAYNESTDFIHAFLNSKLCHQNVLMILVINQPDDCLELKVQARQQALYDEVSSLTTLVWQAQNLSLHHFNHSRTSCLIVDRFTKPIERKLGVGLARKIGCDIACQLIAKNVVTSNWLHSTDADATLPNDYFSALDIKLSQTNNQPPAVAACYNFHHQCDNKAINEANLEYEQSLRYYVAGLTYSSSPYNFFTIGSILAFSAQAYASVRGFPKKSAGEDFYLVNKLAKLGQVIWLEQTVILLEARTSNRVPFGTGPAVKKLLALKGANQSFDYYHPQIFNDLKRLYQAYDTLFESREELEQWCSDLPKHIVNALESLDINNFLAKQHKANKTQFNKQLHVWFDAFKTLKFIHYLRDHQWPNIPFDQACKQALFFSHSPKSNAGCNQ